MALPSFTTFTAFTKIKSSEVNANFTSIYNVFNGNIENANVAAAAAIARSKLASGTADHVLINNGSGVMSSEASLAVTRGGTGLSAAALGDLIYGSAANTLSRLTGNTTTTQKFLRQVGDGVNSAAPSWEAVSLSAGVTGTLPIANGGTGQTSQAAAFNALHPMTTTGDMIYASSGSTAARLAVGSSGQVIKSVGGVPTWATFSGGINYLSSNPDAESDTAGWSTYADAAGAQPVNGTGGSPTETWTRTTSSPLRGAGSFLLTKDAADRQGEGVSFDFTADSADQAKILQIDFDYTVASGTYATGDLTVYLYDVTNAVVIQPAGYQIQNITTGLPSKHIATFQTASNSTSYRFIIHTASTSASAYTVKFDNFRVGPQIVEYGAPVTDWVAWTPTGSWSTNTTYTGFKRRVGDTGEYVVRIALGGAPTAVTLTVNQPTSETIDTAKLTETAANEHLMSSVGILDTSAGDQYTGIIRYNSSTSVAPRTLNSAVSNATTSPITQAAPVPFASGDVIILHWVVPISGWSSTVQMSNDTDTRVVTAVLGTGTATLTSSFSDVSFTAVNDTHGAFNGTTTYTIPVPGYYRFSAQARFSSSGAITATNAIGLQLLKNGSSVKDCSDFFLTTTAQWNSLVHEGLFAAGDTIKLQAKNGNANPTFGSPGAPTFYIERLSGPSAIAASESVSCSYSGSTTAQTGSAAVLVFPTKLFDTHNAYNTSTGIYSVPVSGKYQVSGYSKTGNTVGTGSMLLQAVQTGSASVTRELGMATKISATSAPKVCNGIAVFNCVAGDTLQLRGSDADSNAVVAASHIEIVRVGN